MQLNNKGAFSTRAPTQIAHCENPAENNKTNERTQSPKMGSGVLI